METHKLTNRDIAEQYSDIEIFTMINDFRGAFACWIIKQDGSRSYDLALNAIKSYTDYLERTTFSSKDDVIKMSIDRIKELTSDILFESIPEIMAMNQIKSDFVDLGALSRNVFYHILREHITQPL